MLESGQQLPPQPVLTVPLYTYLARSRNLTSCDSSCCLQPCAAKAVTTRARGDVISLCHIGSDIRTAKTCVSNCSILESYHLDTKSSHAQGIPEPEDAEAFKARIQQLIDRYEAQYLPRRQRKVTADQIREVDEGTCCVPLAPVDLDS